MPYLFVHFREKLTPDGEQVHFAVSENGYDWKSLNGGKPILTCDKGERGCRDIEIVRLFDGSFVLVATDLCIVRHMDDQHNVNWRELSHYGSQSLSLWRTNDLMHFSPQERIDFSGHGFGCLWAPEVFWDEIRGEYLLHWSSMVNERMAIYGCATKDFRSFSAPKLIFQKGNDVIDSHLVKYGDRYHLFYKNCDSPAMCMHAESDDLYGPYQHDAAFSQLMASFDKPGCYEAPTTLELPDGRWCLMLDFFGCEKDKMGYVPFVSETVGNAAFKRNDRLFTFPYGFKHGHPVPITNAEYDAICAYYGIN